MSSIREYIEKNPQSTQRLLGVDYEQLQQLIAQGEARHAQKQVEIEQSKVRLIKAGGGRKTKLAVPDQIILTLLYLRHLNTFQLLGVQFGVSESTANDTFHYWLPILKELLPASMLEQVKKNESDYELVQEILSELELIVDSSEQVRERPGDYEEQKAFYSGNQKNHTRKNQLIVLPSGRDIVDVTAGEPGPKSDINLFRERQKQFDHNQKFTGDKAYQGEANISTPHKKPKLGELTMLQKQSNRELSARRIVVEHVIRLVKIFRAAQERFRLRPETYEQVILTICGLVRFRIGALILQS